MYQVVSYPPQGSVRRGPTAQNLPKNKQSWIDCQYVRTIVLLFWKDHKVEPMVTSELHFTGRMRASFFTLIHQKGAN